MPPTVPILAQQLIALADTLAGQSQAYKIGYYVGSVVGVVLILLFIRAIFKRRN